MNSSATVTFTCAAFGTPDAFFAWRTDQALLSNDSRFTITQDILEENGRTFIYSILEICNVGGEDATEYSCFAENSFGNDSASFELRVVGGVLLEAFEQYSNKHNSAG